MSSSTYIDEPAVKDTENETAKSTDTTVPSPSSSTTPSTKPPSDDDASAQTPPVSNSRSEEGLINEMKNFDNLLRMLSVYRDNPDFRGNPNDKNIEEIAKVLSGFIGDDIDNFLSDEEEREEVEVETSRQPDSQASNVNDSTSNHDSNNKDNS